MNKAKKSFINLALQCGVLKFGQFKLKSGRISPYFFNAGLFYTADALHQVGQLYANALIEQAISYDHLFGPAYKGIPLATATAMALAAKGINPTVTFNRKEVKDHGEGGQLIGAPLTGKTIIIDDVITAGTAFREAQQQIKDQSAELIAVLIMLDRCERNTQAISTTDEIRQQGINVISLITLFDLIDYLKAEGDWDRVKVMEGYLGEYGVG